MSNSLKYLWALVIPAVLVAALYFRGLFSFGGLFVAFAAIPLLEFMIQDDGSSLYGTKDARMVDVRVRNVNSVFSELKIDRVACVKMNIEGAEYEVLCSLIESGWISCCDSFLIQFHKQPVGYQEKLNFIHSSLSTTHKLEWAYPFIWELWTKK
jgi:hypothetical protein